MEAARPRDQTNTTEEAEPCQTRHRAMQAAMQAQTMQSTPPHKKGEQ